MTTTQSEHQELAHLRAEVHRLQADSSRAIAALAECIGERDDLKAKLSQVEAENQAHKSHISELRSKVAGLSGELDSMIKWKKICDPAIVSTTLENQELKQKLRLLNADAAAMREAK